MLCQICSARQFINTSINHTISDVYQRKIEPLTRVHPLVKPQWIYISHNNQRLTHFVHVHDVCKIQHFRPIWEVILKDTYPVPSSTHGPSYHQAPLRSDLPEHRCHQILCWLYFLTPCCWHAHVGYQGKRDGWKHKMKAVVVISAKL